MDSDNLSQPNAGRPSGESSKASLQELERLFRLGRNTDLLATATLLSRTADPDVSLRIDVLIALARFDVGDVVGSLAGLRHAAANSTSASLGAQFSSAYAHFLRESDFLSPDSLVPHLSRLRQLASRVGDRESLASLHLAVARAEGARGHYLTSRHHLELARSLAARSNNLLLRMTIDLIEASLESFGGDLPRSRRLASTGLQVAVSEGFVKHELAALTNLAVVSVLQGRLDQAAESVNAVLSSAAQLNFVRVGALDTLAQLELRRGRLGDCESALHDCSSAIAQGILPARSWYDLAHQVTRCAYSERLGDWETVVDIADKSDAETERRQYKAVRTALLCAKARALARLGRHKDASASLAAAVRACPRGAVDPLIVLEASKGLSSALRGATATGRLHYERALAACRAIGHKYHEWWITEQRDDVLKHAGSITSAAPAVDVTHASVLLNDVATALGAGHSIDLLSHRIAGILKATALADRVDVSHEGGLEYRPEPAAEFSTEPDGTNTIRIYGSDRLATITIRRTESIEEISLVKSVTDLVQMAVARTADTQREDEDLTLWPRAAEPFADDTIFRSPRMIELVRIAERLAETKLPILITGETGTGKEVFARLIHDRSPSKRGPFVPFNCSAVTRELVESQLFGHRRGAFTGAVDAFPGVIRAAERGTLFLDEIGDLEPVVQPKLLRFLESGEILPVGDSRPQQVNVRIVAATNSDLGALAKDGRFRRDLYYRIGVAHLELPSLRERKDEIPAFAALFLTRYAVECGRKNVRLADDLIAALLLYDWPGNIRQLANEIRRAVALASDGQVLGAADLAADITINWNARPASPSRSAAAAVEVRLDQPLARAFDELERKFIEHALQASNGKVADAAQLLGLSRKGLFLKRRRAGLVGHGEPEES